MRGETDRECRAAGGALKKQSAKNVVREAKGAHPKNEPDGTLSRGGGPIFRKRGGKIPPSFLEGADEPEGRARGGRTKKQLGGQIAPIAGVGQRPGLGRPVRARGGGVGADLHPKTHDAGAGPKQRKIMPESEKIP
ncbi:MAG TPA: hypothetical protein VGL12_15370 [Roseiarcus sp.]|jgi:hypothetical protein